MNKSISQNTLERIEFGVHQDSQMTFDSDEQKEILTQIEQNERFHKTIEKIRSYMEYDSEIMLSERDRLLGIDKALREHYSLKSESNG